VEADKEWEGHVKMRLKAHQQERGEQREPKWEQEVGHGLSARGCQRVADSSQESGVRRTRKRQTSECHVTTPSEGGR
jgi:hypothetical protein